MVASSVNMFSYFMRQIIFCLTNWDSRLGKQIYFVQFVLCAGYIVYWSRFSKHVAIKRAFQYIMNEFLPKIKFLHFERIFVKLQHTRSVGQFWMDKLYFVDRCTEHYKWIARGPQPVRPENMVISHCSQLSGWTCCPLQLCDTIVCCVLVRKYFYCLLVHEHFGHHCSHHVGCHGYTTPLVAPCCEIWLMSPMFVSWSKCPGDRAHIYQIIEYLG